MAHPTLPSSLHPPFTLDHQEVIRSENIYLAQRREHHDLTQEGDGPSEIQDLWGIAFSGGGIRSATLSLGMIQKLITEDYFKRFDYMSSVSGGGYMASCLSSLMNNETDTFFVPKVYRAAPGERSAIPGLGPDTSPLVRLIETKEQEEAFGEAGSKKAPPQQKARYLPAQMQSEAKRQERLKAQEEIILDYKEPEKTKLDVRHQIHHLRTHGEYLTPDRGVLSVDVQKVVGTVLAGIVHNFFLFFLFLTAVVALHFIFFDWLSNETFFDTITGQSGTATSFWTDGFTNYLTDVMKSLSKYPWLMAGVSGAGLILSVVFVAMSRGSARNFANSKSLQSVLQLLPLIPAGHDQEDYFERRFVSLFGGWNILGGLLLAGAIWGLGNEMDLLKDEDYWLFFALPGLYSIGVFLGTYFILAFVSQQPRQIRYSRSLHGALRGSAFYGLLVSMLTPLVLLFLFSISLYWKGTVSSAESNSSTLISTISSIASVVAGYFTLNQEGGDSSSMITRILSKVKGPLLSVLVLIFVGLSTYSIIRILSNPDIENFASLALGVATILFVLTGLYVNSNKLSLHYFYRDRLSEAYLRTDARVQRKDQDRQGMPLINLRNDEDLRLKNLGWQKLQGQALREAQTQVEKGIIRPSLRYDEDGNIWQSNPRAPYHLIVTALNLQGTDELVRKDLKSDHFIFSRNYIGSHSTGYVRTDRYRQGRTKLARAMTISAAAVSSGMGFSSFFAQSFIITLLNLRLGYWVENPWFYRRNCNEQRVDSAWRRMILKWRGWEDVEQPEEEGEGRYCMRYNPKRKFTFWPTYLFKELLGLTTADKRLVNVSDGGHTGDNLGLLPLLRRRCKVIVVGDFEEDRKFGFGSFNHLVRMANIEENIEIKINLQSLEPKSEKEDPRLRSANSVALGTIHYPDNNIGHLIYVKSSINQQVLPVNVYNYRKLHPDFPHESTADQYFDDSQFEAYRALGFHMGQEVIEVLRQRLWQVKK
ncbi:MAG: patatin-like phospholipase family protein [Bacteroidota bacterium]